MLARHLVVPCLAFCPIKFFRKLRLAPTYLCPSLHSLREPEGLSFISPFSQAIQDFLLLSSHHPSKDGICLPLFSMAMRTE